MEHLRRCEAPFLIAALIAVASAVAGCGPHRPRPVPDPASRRVTQAGAVVGFEGRYGNHAWLGIPYAAPPVGDLRWRAPRPAAPWSGTFEAVAFPSPCTQFASSIGGVTRARLGTPVGSEDCLYLNVYAPRFTPEEVPEGMRRLPVMVWIHGGGNTIGESAFYDGGNLAARENLVVVTLNYRLGPFGWFRHAALRGTGTSGEDQSGNFGTLDHIRALAWVRDNISAFGGDPERVTIFGESAGGTNVFALLLSPQAKGLFHRAIVQSGVAPTSSPVEAENATDDPHPGHWNSSNEVLVRLIIRDGMARDRTTAGQRLMGMTPAQIEGYLRGKDAYEILTAYTPMPRVGMIRMPRVFRDGVVLPAREPMECFSQPGAYNQVPVILGTNRDENKLFMFGDPRRVRKILWFIPRLRDERHYNLSAEYMSKLWKAQGADEPASAMGRAQTPSVFVYRFDWDEEPTVLGADLSVMLGAAHGFEIPFVFGHWDLGREGNRIFTDTNRPGREELSARMMSYWAEFAYTGNPERGRDGHSPEWTPWTVRPGDEPRFLVLDTAAGGGVRLSTGSLTRTGVLAAVDSDSRLPSQREKCMIFREMAEWSIGLSKEEYPTAGARGCAEYPFDGYPWRE